MPEVRRFAQVVRLRPEMEAEYLALHADAWPGVLENMTRHHVQNFSIYLHAGVLFAYFEYTGQDFDADMAAIGEGPEAEEWARRTSACQLPFDEGRDLWASMTEVFHLE